MTQEDALDILKTGKNVFLTGEPGSGKTHTINQYVRYLREHGIEPAITASTGIAATHIGGYTIHSWSGIGIRDELSPYELEALHEKKSLVRRVRNTRVLIIDEISMLDGRILDLVDAVLKTLTQRTEPFGGIQIVCVGDFFQLPPVARGREPMFAFQSGSWQAAQPVTCYLSEQFRHTDAALCRFLSALRGGAITEEHMELLRERVCDDESALPDAVTKLYSHNVDVDRINDRELETLSGGEEIFEMETQGRGALVEQLKRGCLSPERLALREGAVVMCTKNNFEQGYVNGTIGVVKTFEKRTRYPIIETEGGTRITVSEMEWAIEEEGKVLAKVTQIPLRLAWAITVHKSQGVSVDRVVVDLSRAFEYGQGYVALSRVRTLAGLFCLGYNDRALMIHPRVAERDAWFRSHAKAVRDKFSSLSSDAVRRMHESFLTAAGGRIQKISANEKKKKRESTYDKTGALIAKAATLEELAESRGLTVSTILTHLEKLAAKGAVTEHNLRRLWNARGRDQRELNKVCSVFRAQDEAHLRPAHDSLKGKFSFEDLRLARLFVVAHERIKT